MAGILAVGPPPRTMRPVTQFLNRAATVPKPVAVAGFEDIRRHWDAHVKHWSAKILPGEFYVTRSVEAVSTVLGSCIAACIRDSRNGIGGMNHFMLPEERNGGSDAWREDDGTPSTRYGAYAMESLINEILKLGAKRDNLELKLFGGGRILPTMTDIGRRNIEFVRRFAQLEHLRVVAEDVGSTTPRHVIFFPATGRVLLKHLRPIESDAVADGDVKYRERLTESPVDSDVELFD